MNNIELFLPLRVGDLLLCMKRARRVLHQKHVVLYTEKLRSSLGLLRILLLTVLQWPETTQCFSIVYTCDEN
jgi:hypothetical protein